LKGLAQYMWPKFPDANGVVTARRMTGGVIAAR
jgi:soluble lytic murein transglycosylase